MAASDFLFQSKVPSTFTSPIETRSDMPDWYQAARRQLITRAAQIAGTPYKAYTGPRVQALNADQQSAFDKTRETVAQGNPYQEQAASFISGSTGFDQGKFDQFLNPYRQGALDELTRQATRNLNENLLPQVSDTFTGAGMFGSTRHADFAGRALRDTQESLLGQQANLLNNSYTDAMNAYGADQGRSLTAGQQLGALGQLTYNQGLSGAAALESIGNTQQQQGQRSLDLAYQDFIDQRDAPLRNLETLSGTINAYTPDPNKVGYTSQQIPQANYQASPLSQILGALK